jgi:hypothetical protein
MAEPLDVAARLTEGRPAVDNVGEYVWACHLLGYQNPDLTLHAAQVRDWYGSEDGLDLQALDADRAALDAAAAAADNARRLQEQQLVALADAWQGRGGDASRDFLLRHGEASAAAASAVRDAVDALAALRDDLWHAVDEKVGTVVAIEERRQTQRPEWLAATQTVTTGAGDRAVASELIDQQVKPFVDNDIRSDWLTAMQKAMTAVAAAFDAATDMLTGQPPATFEVPGDLGPSSMPSTAGSAPPAEATGTAPSAWSAPAPAAAAPAVSPISAPAPAPAPAFAAAPEPYAAPTPAVPAPASGPPAMPTMPSFGDPGGGLAGGGLPGGAGGLAGLGSQLADAIGGLFDQPEDALPEPPDVGGDAIEEEPAPHEELASDAENNDEETDDESDPETADVTETEEAVAGPVDACADEEPVDDAPPAEPDATPPPEPVSPPVPPPIVEPPPSQEPVGAETPCEIAADELPQAGP